VGPGCRAVPVTLSPSMNQLLIQNARVILEDGVRRGSVLVRDGLTALVFDEADAPVGLSAAEAIDAGGAYLAPGMIDIHIHGSTGVDVQEADEQGLRKLSEFLLSEGVTGYFATLVPTDHRGYASAIKAINSYIRHQDEKQAGWRGARVLGIHFEGPFVSTHKCGALKREHFRVYDGDPRSIELFAGSDGSGEYSGARLMTLAPEITGGINLVEELTRRGVRPFIGHSQADEETLETAFDAGARHITHFPNALDPLHHRKPGAVGWGLVRRDITIDCIADFHHVAPLMLRLMHQSKGAGAMALISDAIKPAGLGDGDYTVWDLEIAVRGGKTSLAHGPSQGTIAGSVITMRDAVKNIASLGVPVHEAVGMASLAPARAAGIENLCGSIKPGKRADLLAFDEDFSIKIAIIAGAIALDRR
jgi:N-acetylglucosamine-6-phosphate deacetylase